MASSEPQPQLGPPTDFKRMLSWQLSHPLERSSKARKKKGNQKRKGPDPVIHPPTQSPPGSDSSSPEDCGSSFAYITVNSDGEEELYFSAPESPQSRSSDDEAMYSPRYGPSGVAKSPTAIEGVRLPPQSRKPGALSKKAKKKLNYISRMAQIEFFQPLCDLVEQKLSVEALGEMGVSNQAEVPKLAELCIKEIYKLSLVDPESDSLPFLIHSLMAQDRSQRSVVSTHVRWLERLLASFESLALSKAKTTTASNPHPQPRDKLAYADQELWEDLSLDSMPEYYRQPHVPLPRVHCLYFEEMTVYNLAEYYPLFRMRVLFHFANLMFPAFTARKPPADSSHRPLLTPSQLAAIRYVNNFLTTRYKALCAEVGETLQLWPSYVYWARGQLKLAADAFLATLQELKCPRDRAVLLNEMGRMFSLFGDRAAAGRFFRQSAEEEVERAVFPADTKLVQPCVLALIAASWDCGLLSGAVAKEAARAWQAVLKEAARLSSGAWYLHMAAGESRLGVHCGQPTGVDPSDPTQGVSSHGNGGGSRGSSSSSSSSSGVSPTQRWLEECQQLLSSLAPSQPVLLYHLSLVAAMMGHSHTASECFSEFDMRYSGFREWPGGVRPGLPFPSPPSLPPSPHHHPWLPLLSILSRQRLPHAPVLPVQWRTHLLHPHYPHVPSGCISYLADHCSQEVGLRLTCDGFLTADVQMDLPPLRCVRLDPYTGSLCFSRSSSLEHYHSNISVRNEAGSSSPFNCPERCVLPWPVRLYESERCVVELVQASTSDFESQSRFAEASYTLTLHRHDSSGSHRKLDLRKIVRKELRQAVLALAEQKGWEGKEAMVDKLMERGLHYNLDSVHSNTVSPKYRPQQHYSRKRGGGAARRREGRVRNSGVRDFSLSLTSYVVFGEATLMLGLSTSAEYSQWGLHGQALVLVNCASEESFLRPRVYCVGDQWGFQCLYPDPSTALPAHTCRHFRHVRYASAIRTENVPKKGNATHSTQLVFDVNGGVVFSKVLAVGTGRRELSRDAMWISATLADRLLRIETERGVAAEVCSYSPQLEDRVHYSLPPSDAVTELAVAPGLLLLHTLQGLLLLHPATLQPLAIKGLDEAKRQGRPLLFPPQQQAGSQKELDDNYLHFVGSEMVFSVVKVFDVCYDAPAAQEAPPSTDTTASASTSTVGEASIEVHQGLAKMEVKGEFTAKDFGSCSVAFTLDNRLLIVKVSQCSELAELTLDGLLPGRITELMPMGKFGFMVSVTQFPDSFREELYWLSESGLLLGMLPCLGAGPHSFLYATLAARPPPPCATTAEGEPLSPSAVDTSTTDQGVPPTDTVEDDGSGLYVFFSDGQGGIVCVRPSVIM